MNGTQFVVLDLTHNRHSLDPTDPPGVRFTHQHPQICVRRERPRRGRQACLFYFTPLQTRTGNELKRPSQGQPSRSDPLRSAAGSLFLTRPWCSRNKHSQTTGTLIIRTGPADEESSLHKHPEFLQKHSSFSVVPLTNTKFLKSLLSSLCCLHELRSDQIQLSSSLKLISISLSFPLTCCLLFTNCSLINTTEV